MPSLPIAFLRQRARQAWLMLQAMRLRSAKGHRPVDSQRPTVLVVSHEASFTGAPVLALNLCEQLQDTHNVVTLLLGPGPLLEAFTAASCCVLTAAGPLVSHRALRRALGNLPGGQAPTYAIVNTIVARSVLRPLHLLRIPTLNLIHEFPIYIQPPTAFLEAAFWASRLVVSTPMTWRDIQRACPELAGLQPACLPQGACRPPMASDPRPPKDSGTWQAVRHRLAGDTVLVLGVGAVQPRKGVDLFISAAARIRELRPHADLLFLWLGSGYRPAEDLQVSVWLADQIQRSNLEGSLVILEHAQAYAELIQRCDLFLLTSRLDPLPNVAIDALLAGKPVMTFEKASGIAELQAEDPDLAQACLAPYLDAHVLGNRAADLLADSDRLARIGDASRALADRHFSMGTYLSGLEDLAAQAKETLSHQQRDLGVLVRHCVIDRDFHGGSRLAGKRSLAIAYVRQWRTGIHARKPFPGFHPGIYAERVLGTGEDIDPLVHYLEAGRPAGPWAVPVITPERSSAAAPRTSTALHIHVHYPELLAPILQRLAWNGIRPTLFISLNKESALAEVKAALDQAGHRDAEVRLTPNRGRDLGPLITEFGQILDAEFDFHGHIHTKKSVLVPERSASRWRAFLLGNLLGHRGTAMADTILTRMAEDSDLGLVFPQDPGCLNWSANRPHAEALATRLGLPPLPTAIDFPVGSMFWARRGALTPLYNLGLQWKDYPEEPVGYDGTMLHAIERLIPQVCLNQGMHYGVSHTPGLNR